MKLISKEGLVKGKSYYIECTTQYDGLSCKKSGIFDNLVYPCGENPAFAQFRILKDLPNAIIPTGMGNLSINFYSTLNYKFYLPEKDKIFLKYIIDEKHKQILVLHILFLSKIIKMTVNI